MINITDKIKEDKKQTIPQKYFLSFIKIKSSMKYLYENNILLRMYTAINIIHHLGKCGLRLALFFFF